MNEVQLPVNVEAEHAALGSVLISRKALDEVTELLQVRDFHVPRHQAVYAAVRRLHDADEPVDTVTVVDELMKQGALQGGLDVAFIQGLTESVATASTAGFYAGIVREQSVRRQVLEAAHRAAQIATDQSVQPAALVELARETFDEVGGEAQTRDVEAIGDWLTDYLTSLDQKPNYTPSPWYDLNDLINGFRDGGMYVVAARPAVGKTVIGVQIAKHIAKERPVVIVSLEMDRNEIAARLIAQDGQVFLGSLNKHELSKAEFDHANQARSRLADLPLVILGSDEVTTIPQLKAKVRQVARKFKQNPVVIIDYLQLFTSDGHVESRQVEVSGFSRQLKLAAQQWRVPVVALSQLNRGSANRKKHEPVLSDLRESGAIEQDADCVLLLHPKEVRGAADDLVIIVAKNRQGRTGSVTLQMQGQFARAVAKAGWSEELNYNGKAA